MAAASVPGSPPIAGTNLCPPSDPACSFLSSWRWASHHIPTGFSRLEAGAGLWNSKAQKVQQGLALLCLNLPPTTLLAFPFCQVLHAGDKKWQTARARMGVGEKSQQGGHRPSVFREWENRIGRHLGQLVMPSIRPLFHAVRLGWAGTTLPRQCGKAVSFQAGQEVLRRWVEGCVPRGEYLFEPRPGPTDDILGPLFTLHVFSLAAFQHKWFCWGELTLNDKAGKPKVHSIPDSSLVGEGEGV